MEIGSSHLYVNEVQFQIQMLINRFLTYLNVWQDSRVVKDGENSLLCGIVALQGSNTPQAGRSPTDFQNTLCRCSYRPHQELLNTLKECPQELLGGRGLCFTTWHLSNSTCVSGLLTQCRVLQGTVRAFRPHLSPFPLPTKPRAL